MKHTGSCLCGQVNFEVIGSFSSFFLCHCQRCQKDTGSAHAANLFSETAQLNWLTGEDQVTVYTLPATRHTRSFCSRCGSAVPTQQANGALLAVPAGSLNSEINIEPSGHIFMNSQAQWEPKLKTAYTYGTLPTDEDE